MSTPAGGSPPPHPVRWGMLSTAAIGRVAATSIRGSEHAQFIAVASRDKARAARFAGELGLAHSFGSYEELLADDQVDAVYVPLPIAMHIEWTIAALRATSNRSACPPFPDPFEHVPSAFRAAHILSP